MRLHSSVVMGCAYRFFSAAFTANQPSAIGDIFVTGNYTLNNVTTEWLGGVVGGLG